ncbi:MAG: copper chaperone PCu(A)C [Rhodospirillales bacterium]
MKNITRLIFMALATLPIVFSMFSLFAPAVADNMNSGIHIMKPWSRATPPGAANGAAFMVIMNKSHQADRLVRASSDIAKKTELHTHKMDGDIMRMRHVDSIPVDAGGSATLKPGGYHVMFFGLKKPLVKGETFSVTLEFEHAGKKTVDVTVQKIGAMKSKSSSGAHHHH